MFHKSFYVSATWSKKMRVMDVLRWVWRLGFGLVLFFTIAVSLLPQSEMPSHNFSDKLGHFLTYFGLGLSGALALERRARNENRIGIPKESEI